MYPNLVKQALKEGKPQFGCGFWQLRSPEALRALAAAGFNWTFIDTEHGNFDYETVTDLCRTGPGVGICPIVRVADLQYALVARALDCGAQGIIFPRVEDPELLARAVSWTRFPPQGVRGFGLAHPHTNYKAATMSEVIAHYNEHTLVVLQIESALAVERREELISVPGVDVVMIGPADLSISLGVPGEFENPKLVAAVEAVRDTCRKHGVAPGIHNRALKMAQFWKQRGMLFIGCANELGMLSEKATEIIKALQ